MRYMLNNLTNVKFYVMVLSDLAIFGASLWLAYRVRFDFYPPNFFADQCLEFMKYALPLKAAAFFVFGQYKGMWRYTALSDFGRLLAVTVLQSALFMALVYFRFGFTGIPRSIFLLDWVLTLTLASGLRLSIRSAYSLLDSGKAAARRSKPHRRVLVVGAGRAGEQIAREISSNPGLNYKLVGLLDDAHSKLGRSLHGHTVLGTVDDLRAVASRKRAEEIFIAISEASGREMRRIVEACKASGLPYKTLPPMGEILNGRVDIKSLRDVNYLDLLGRTQVNLDTQGISGYLRGKTVLVTGCGGSIGSELCRQIIRFQPKTLVLLDLSEYALHQLEMELKHELGFNDYVTVLGSITDKAQLDRTFDLHNPQVVFHAAAYKHVPMMERNPWRAVENNVTGTINVMQSAHEHGAGRFVLVSTDKAVRPTNVMGASKRVTELAMNFFTGSATSFIAVRFGNVIGSSGSVMPLFRRQIERGGPVTVTDPEVTRYFMSIPEAAQLILQAGAMGRGGEIFVLEMGVPVKIADMARDMIRLSGKEPDKDVKIVFTGLREGEKLYEELITEGEDVVRTEHEKIMVLKSTDTVDSKALEQDISRLVRAARTFDSGEIRAALKNLVPEFKPASN